MPTAAKMPQVLQDLLQSDPSEIRRRTRCSLKEAREVHEALQEGVWAVLQFPDLVAQLLGDPQPRLLRKFSAQRSSLLRKVRRGQRLDALRDVMEDGELSQFQARDFLLALARQGENWERLEKLYGDPGDDFWQKRPQPEEPAGIAFEMVFAPEVFDPDLVLDWLRKGEHRAAVRWLRQLSGASRQDCQDLVDRLEEALFERHPDPWRLVSRLWPGVVAPLAGLPDPDWLEILEPQRSELLDNLHNQRSAAATQLVAETIPCSPVQARRFLRLLSDGEKWDTTLETFTQGQVFAKPRPKVVPPKPKAPEPKVEAPKVKAPEAPPPVLEAAAAIVAAAAPEFTGVAPPPEPSPSPWAAQREKDRLAAEATRQKEREAAELNRQKEREASERRRQAELEAADRARHEEREKIEAARNRELGLTQKARQLEEKTIDESRQREVVPPPAQKLDINDIDQVIDRLTRLGQACAAKNSLEAILILDELEQAGLNRSYVAARFPAILPWLPDDPWSDHLDKLGVFAPILGKLLKGEVNATELAKQWISGSQVANLGDIEKVVGALEKAWKTKNRADLEVALGLLKENPHLAEEINRRVPWLGDLMDMDRDGTPDVIEAFDDPAAYFGDLMRTRFPELETRLGETRIQKIKEILPELLQTMKERNMRGVMRVLSRLRLGPSDVKALLGALKHMHR